jgi:hypothetical protein
VPETLSQKYPIQKMADGVAQVVEGLPSKCETLSSNPDTTKKKKKVITVNSMVRDVEAKRGLLVGVWEGSAS